MRWTVWHVAGKKTNLLRSRNRRFRQVRLSRPAPCAIIFMRSPQCDKLDTLVIRSHCPRKLAVQHCLAQSAAISMVLPTLTSEGALTIDLVCPRVTFGRRLYALGGGSGTEGRAREREGTEGGEREREKEREREREKRKDRGPSPVHSMRRERERDGSGGRTEGLAQSAAISMVLPTLTSEGALTIVDIVRRRFVWLALPPYPGAFYVHLWAPRT